MSDIPLSICLEILLRLPAVSLFRFRAVCKRWRAVIDDPCFVKTHTDNQLSSNNTNIIIRNSTGPPFNPLYYFDLEALKFIDGPQTIPVTPLNLSPSGLLRLQALPVPACNGLMLIVPECRDRNRGNEINWDPKGTWEMWNPLTHERLTLPRQQNIKLHVLGIGLGYDYAADDYKVVVIDYEYDDVNDKSVSQTHVYSLKSDSWRKIGNCPFNFWSRKIEHAGFLKSRNIQHGVFLKGALHWVSDDEIIVFDVATGNYLQLALPSFKRKPESMRLDALNGCLYLSYYGGDKYKEHFDVWVMNDYCGVKDSWMKLFSMNKRDVYIFYGLRPVAYMKNKRWLLLKNYNGFIWFDVESDSMKTVKIHGICRDNSAQICAGSLFRLHDSCGRVAAKTGTRERKSRMKMGDTKLTFCVKDFVRYDRCSYPQHDTCYSSSNWHNLSSEGENVHALSFNPDIVSPTLSISLDVCREILLRLPAKSLIRFRAVCETWRTIIDEPCFVRAHTNKQLTSNTLVIRNSTPPFYPLYSFDLDSLYFTDGLQKIPVTPLDFTPSGLSLLRAFPVSTCDGLILVAGKSWEIWNPVTHERLKLPRGNCNSNPKGEAIGLGYDYRTNDYKVVVIHRHRLHRRPRGRGGHVFRTHIYSLRSGSWRNIENCPCDDDWRWLGPHGPGVFLCGALHWPLLKLQYEPDTIIVLDLGTENYRQLQAPPFRKTRGLHVQNRYLNVLGGCLTMSDFGKLDSSSIELEHYDVWVMKDYGVEDSWIKLFSLEDKECVSYNIGYHSRPVAYTKDKTQIILQEDGFWGCSPQDYYCRFFMFDVESNSMKRVGIHGLSGTLSAQIIPGSIFRLHDNCGVSGRRSRRIMRRESNMKVFDTELTFCVRDAKPLHNYHSHDSCYSLDSNWDYSSCEDGD